MCRKSVIWTIYSKCWWMCRWERRRSENNRNTEIRKSTRGIMSATQRRGISMAMPLNQSEPDTPELLSVLSAGPVSAVEVPSPKDVETVFSWVSRRRGEARAGVSQRRTRTCFLCKQERYLQRAVLPRTREINSGVWSLKRFLSYLIMLLLSASSRPLAYVWFPKLMMRDWTERNKHETHKTTRSYTTPGRPERTTPSVGAENRT